MAPDTPLPYSAEEAAAIRQMLAVSHATVVCPTCKGALTFSKAGRADQPIWELRCSYCHKSLIVGNLKGRE